MKSSFANEANDNLKSGMGMPMKAPEAKPV